MRRDCSMTRWLTADSFKGEDMDDTQSELQRLRARIEQLQVRL